MMKAMRSILLTGVLFACSDSTGPSQVEFTVISGDNQPGKAGQELSESFVVRVSDRLGRGIRDVVVGWTVTSGEGVLNGLWKECAGSEYSSPVAKTWVRTDSDGFARMSFMPTVFDHVTVVAAAGEGLGPQVTFRTDATDPGATLAIVSGDGQERTAAYAMIDGEAFVAQVRDGEGNPVSHVPVTWSVASGEGWLANWFPPCSDEPVTRTGNYGDGATYMEFVPTVFGMSTVSAAVAGAQGSPVTFTVDATLLVINFGFDYWSGENYFTGPKLTSAVTVPVGAVVEFRNFNPAARIRSTVTPPGGASLDSGPLSEGERFQFVPEVAGTWKLVDENSGATGSLTAQ